MARYVAEVLGGPKDGLVIPCDYDVLRVPIPISLSYKDIDINNPTSPRIECDHYIYSKAYNGKSYWVEEKMLARILKQQGNG